MFYLDAIKHLWLEDLLLMSVYFFFVISDFLCIWNTNFQTLQAGKEMAGKMYGQVGMVLK